ncbi:TRAP transporter large permease subunit [Sulfitobacter sp. 1A16787]|uniref:TRAP transporter large permease n=1 Tax=Sulfitobacter sp. 1A16787 TaxID=3368571 RepID=UPI0037467F75
MEEYILPLAMLLSLMAGIFTGYPVAFVLGGIGVAFMFVGEVPLAYMGIVASRISGGILENWLLIAVPLFVAMGILLEKSGIANNLLVSLEKLCGRLRGGLAASVALLGIVLASSTGIIGASVVMLGVLALPLMLRQGYNASLATGVIAASGTLGIIIPPSIMLVLMGAILGISVGDLFKAALFPGILLGMTYVAYIFVLGWLRPEQAPLPEKIESSSGIAGDLLALVRDLLGPLILIATVLGSILAGIATPTEASGLGAAGAFLLALFSGRMKLSVLSEVVRSTGSTTGMIIFVMIGATCFSAVFKRLGGDTMIEDAILSLELGAYGTLLVLMAVIFVLGFFLEWVEISFVVLPLFAPVISGLDYTGVQSDEILVWFTILVAMNLQTSFLTPPFGYALFYIRGVTPPEVRTSEIYKGVMPFVAIQLLCLAALIAWPTLSLYLVRVLS